MTVRSGRLSSVNGQTSVQQWAVNLTSTPNAFAASNTGGGRSRRPGAMAWNGSLIQIDAVPTLMPNDIFTFQGYYGDDLSDGGKYITGQAIVESVAITWNWATADVVRSTINFQGDGSWTEGDGDATDATIPAAPSVNCAKVAWSTSHLSGATYSDWDDVVSVTLTISSSIGSYVNSSTVETINSKKYSFTKRRPGTIDWTLALNEENSDGLPTGRKIQDDVFLRLFTTDILYWEVGAGHIADATGIVADRDTGAIIARTQNISMNATKEGATELGRIIKPGGSLFWGVTPPAS